jgi:RNA polymerase sigma-70 factor (ECF subfamily)
MTLKSQSVMYDERSSRELIQLSQQGDSHALNLLFTRQKARLWTWARGRLPQWARNTVDTNDVVQDALLRTFRRINFFHDRGRGALQAYLREAVKNRVRDELRKIARRPAREELDETFRDAAASPFEITAKAEITQRYKAVLATLAESEQLLIVGRMEMAYTYEQLALATGRASAEAARLAVRRALLKLARKMAE